VDATDAETIRSEALAVLMDVTDSDLGLWQLYRPDGDHSVLSRWLSRDRSGSTSPVLETAQRRVYGGGYRWPIRDPRRPSRGWVQRFSTLTEGGDAQYRVRTASAIYQHAMAPGRIADQCRLLVYAGTRLVGWVGTFRREGEGMFGRDEVRAANAVVDAISSSLVVADGFERSSRPEHACDLLVSPDGEVLHASRTAKPWLLRPDAHDRVRAWASGRAGREASEWNSEGLSLRWVRLHGPERELYLLSLKPETPLRRAPSWVLTDTELEVANLLSQGLRLRDVAAMLGMAPETARTHRKHVYAKLTVSSRAELARVLSL
jgi:DNA-binding CsgD family transcriptional regulator